MHNDIEIRPAKPDDAPQIAKVHVKSWQEAYKGIVHQSYLDTGLDIGVRTQRWREGLSAGGSETFLAFEHAGLAGFATVGPSRDEHYPSYAELYAIYLDPAYLGKSVGKLLFNQVVQYAVDHGFEKMFANVLIENKIGRNFYERMGAAAIEGSEFEIIIDDLPYRELKYEWKELRL